MKQFAILYAALPVLIFSCTKQDKTGLHPGENQRLFEIIGDSSSVPTGFTQFEYSGDAISRATFWNLNTGDTDVTTFEYDSSNHYIKGVGEKANASAEWFINNLSFPAKTVQGWKNAYGASKTSELDFFYDPRTNHLDSITTIDQNGNAVLVNLFEYTGDNITAVFRRPVDPYEVDTFHFSYDSSPNAFRKADPLFYVYGDPVKYPLHFYDPLTLVLIFSKNMVTTYSFKQDNQTFNYTTSYSVVNNNQLKDFYLLDENLSPTDINSHYIYQ